MNTVAKDLPFHKDETGLSRVEYAYRKIKHNITTNVFPSGFQILEPELAENLGISRTPVREALIRLEADNLIQLIPRRGMRVTPLNPRDILELGELIHCLQNAAIKSVCAPVRDANFLKLDACLNTLREAATSDDKMQWVEAEDKLLLAMMSLTGNQHLKSTADRLFEQFRRAKYLAMGFVEDKSPVLRLHERLIDALKSKNTQEASEAAADYQALLASIFAEVQEKYQLREL